MVELDDGKEDDEVSNFSESFFVDDQAVVTDVDFYRQFANAENDIDNILNEARNEALQDIDQFDEISNLHDGSDNKIEIDEFENSEIDLTKFKETLFPRVDEQQQKIENQFCRVVLYALRFDKNGEKMFVLNKIFKK